MTEVPLRNRTVLATAEVVSACFDFSINLGGRSEQRTPPDLLADFLYAYEFPQPLVAYARTLQPMRGVIKSFVLGLDIRAGQASPLCRRILNRELIHLERTFITSRGGFMALEMIQDYVRSLTGNPGELERYLRSESAPDC